MDTVPGRASLQIVSLTLPVHGHPGLSPITARPLRGREEAAIAAWRWGDGQRILFVDTLPWRYLLVSTQPHHRDPVSAPMVWPSLAITLHCSHPHGVEKDNLRFMWSY